MTSFDRLTTDAELDAILALDDVCFHRPWTRAEYERELQDPARCYLYVVRVDGAIVGYCSFWRIFDEIHLNNFAVHPSRRRHGLGGALLAHVLAESAAFGAPHATLEVRASNTAAIALYERGGFVRTGLRRGYYTHPVEDALILWRGRPGPP